MKDDPAKKNPIQVADRLFGIMELLADCGSLPLQEISVAADLNKTTAFRVLRSLMYMGYVRQDEESGRYSLTSKITSLADKAAGHSDRTALIRPHLVRLMRQARETVHLVRRDGVEAVYIDKVNSEFGTVRMTSHIGGRVPLYRSAVGKAIAAGLDENELKQMWAQSSIQRVTPYTITDFDEYVYSLEDIRKRGYALDNEENETGIRCIAAAITPSRGPDRYAFSISAPVRRMDNDRIRELAQYVLQTKAAIQQDLYM